MSAPKPLPELPPQVVLSNLVTGHWITQAIYVAAKLGIADLLRVGPRSSDDLARAAGAHPRALYRDLLAAAGFRLTRIVPSPSPVSVVEAVPV